MAIVLDLETVATDEAATLVEAKKNLTDPEKIKANLRERLEGAAKYPYTARIIALGWCEEGEDIERVETCDGDASERHLLRDFIPRIWNGHGKDANQLLVTFNGLHYDLPLLMIRCRLLGVPCPEIDIRKYYTSHKDMLNILTYKGELEWRSLTWFAKALGLDTSDAFSGKEIAQLYEDENWDAIKAHCASDVRLTRLVAERWGVLKAPVRVAA
jgi:predicted PolB exonuclease-like 3'-5' exonuclease